MRRPIVFFSVCFSIWTAASTSLAAAADPRSLHWRAAQRLPGLEQVQALAVDAASGDVAIGDERGLLLGRGVPTFAVMGAALDALEWRRFAATGPVRDLHFDGSGALWIASLEGLWRLEPGGRLTDRSPAGAEPGRIVTRVLSRGSVVVAATGEGAFVGGFDAGAPWQKVQAGVPQGAATSLAIMAEAGGLALIVCVRGDLWRVPLRGVAVPGASRSDPAEERPIVLPARRLAQPARPDGEGPVDLFVDVSGGALVAVHPRALVVHRRDPGAGPRFESIHPAWPPGARARRLARFGGRYFLATDAGLLDAPALSGPWRRAASPAGVAPASALAAMRGAILVGGAAGVFEGNTAPIGGPAPPASRTVSAPRRREPTLREIHARALAHQGLGHEHFARLRKRLLRRGRWPVLSLRFTGAHDRDESESYDESFSYGELHRLNDRDRGRSRDFEGSISLAWDLGDAVYPDRAPELSREARQVIGLRDNVLDEITQLYFDRRRALHALNAYADPDDPEAVALRLRADELAAGIDAWTGGWFGRRLAELEHAAHQPHPDAVPKMRGSQ